MNTEKTPLENLFHPETNITTTENGDIAYKNLNDRLLDILFKSEYLRHHLDEASIGSTPKERLFSMFIRDPRYGLGQRELGRTLLKQSNASYDAVLLCGRGDDLWSMYSDTDENFSAVADYVKSQIESKADLCELLKKWCPRFPSHNKRIDNDGATVKSPLTQRQQERAKLARKIATAWGMNKQQYGKFIKAQTVEQHLSRHNEDEIAFEHVPSLAAIKYASAFSRNVSLKERYKEYLDAVRSGNAKINMSVTTVYDIYRNLKNNDFDADLWYDKLQKISGSFMPIIDVSGSMCNSFDSIGKALSIGYYLSDCSTYCNRQFITFSETPELICLPDKSKGFRKSVQSIENSNWGYNTDLGRVFDMLHRLGELPEYIVILTDMQFDQGTHRTKCNLQELWGTYKNAPKIIWWNLTTSTATCPETDNLGNIFMSGYSPMLLQYLEAGFNGSEFLDKLLTVYAEKTGL